jgi:hypothetical protein
MSLSLHNLDCILPAELSACCGACSAASHCAHAFGER